jgi:hypothetical protein
MSILNSVLICLKLNLIIKKQVVCIMYDKTVMVMPTNVVVYYDDIPLNSWERIKELSKLMADNNIGPIIEFIDDEKHILTIEKLTVYEDENFTNLESDNMKSCIAKFHSLSLMHGDLYHWNMGVDKYGNVKIFDYDTIHYKNSCPKDVLIEIIGDRIPLKMSDNGKIELNMDHVITYNEFVQEEYKKNLSLFF